MHDWQVCNRVLLPEPGVTTASRTGAMIISFLMCFIFYSLLVFLSFGKSVGRKRANLSSFDP
jgi:hypothetical protein